MQDVVYKNHSRQLKDFRALAFRALRFALQVDFRICEDIRQLIPEIAPALAWFFWSKNKIHFCDKKFV